MELKTVVILLITACCLCIAMVFTPAADAQTIHALLLIDDDNPSTFHLHEANQKKVKFLLEDIKNKLGIAVRTNILRTTTDRESGDFPTFENIKKWIDTVNVDKNDVVLIYASAHGGANLRTRELYLNFLGVKVERPPIAKAVGVLPCRLRIFLSDASSFGGPINQPYTTKTDRVRPISSTPSKTIYRGLFLEHEGFLDVAGATEGEDNLGNTQGGVFTRSFVEVFEYDAGWSDKNEDGFVSWEEVFKSVKYVTEGKSKELIASLVPVWKQTLEEIGQQSQRPKYFGELPRRIIKK